MLPCLCQQLNNVKGQCAGRAVTLICYYIHLSISSFPYFVLKLDKGGWGNPILENDIIYISGWEKYMVKFQLKTNKDWTIFQRSKILAFIRSIRDVALYYNQQKKLNIEINPNLNLTMN